MNIEIINYGYKNLPKRQYDNDAGADVFVTKDFTLEPHETKRVPLGFGLRLPAGVMAFVAPRSGLSSKGISCELAPIDASYTGEIHAIVVNNTDAKVEFSENDRVGQLLLVPVLIPTLVENMKTRGDNGFGSTGK